MNHGQIRIISQLQINFDDINPIHDINDIADRSLIMSSTAQLQLSSDPSFSANVSIWLIHLSARDSGSISEYTVNISIIIMNEAFKE